MTFESAVVTERAVYVESSGLPERAAFHEGTVVTERAESLEETQNRERAGRFESTDNAEHWVFRLNHSQGRNENRPGVFSTEAACNDQPGCGLGLVRSKGIN